MVRGFSRSHGPQQCNKPLAEPVQTAAFVASAAATLKIDARNFVSCVSSVPKQRQLLQTGFEIDSRPGTHLLER